MANANSGREITEAGKPLLVRDLARIELGAAPLMIRRSNQTRVIRVTGIPVKLSETPGAIYAPPPLLGQHTDEVLEEFGVSVEERGRLREAGVIA